MYQLTNLTNNAKQKIIWVNENGNEIELSFEYRPMQLGWFIGIKYNDVDYKNIRLTNTINLLRSFKNYLPFGLTCITDDGLEPMGVQDLYSGYAKIYMLTREECILFEDKYYEKVSTQL